jgi:hypothetical protein
MKQKQRLKIAWMMKIMISFSEPCPVFAYAG